MNVLSLFDGMSCGQIALERAGIKVDNYFSSEVDKHAIQVSIANYPDTMQLGDVCGVDGSGLPKIDLLIGGSPCQDLSNANIGGRGLEGSKSKLFYEYLRIFKECNPKYFLLENVKCKAADAEIISNLLGVDYIEIDSSLVSAQSRIRYYWTNIPIKSLPQNKHIYLRDVAKKERKWLPMLPWTQKEWGGKKKGASLRRLNCKKSFCLTTNKSHSRNYYLSDCGNKLTKLDSDEAEILQTVPKGYTNHVPEGHRFRMLGNGWTVDVIAHIFKGLKENT